MFSASQNKVSNASSENRVSPDNKEHGSSWLIGSFFPKFLTGEKHVVDSTTIQPSCSGQSKTNNMISDDGVPGGGGEPSDDLNLPQKVAERLVEIYSILTGPDVRARRVVVCTLIPPPKLDQFHDYMIELTNKQIRRVWPAPSASTTHSASTWRHHNSNARSSTMASTLQRRATVSGPDD